VETNLRFCDQLLILQKRINARRLLHVSSVITSSQKHQVVAAETEAESSVEGKPPYSRLKIATELYLKENHQQGELGIIRPGFILGAGLNDPIPGMAKLLPTQHLLGLGAAGVVVPIIDRDKLNAGMLWLCEIEFPQRQVVALFVNKDSPTRADYLKYCCD